MSRSLIRLTATLSAGLVLTLGSLTHAQAAPNELNEIAVAESTGVDHEVPPHHARHASNEVEDPRGSLPVAFLGGAVGLGTTLLISKLMYDSEIEECTEDADIDEGECRYGKSFGNGVFTLLLAPWLTSAGVFAAGALSGGTGGYGWTLLGGVAGVVPPLALAALIAHLGAEGAAIPIALIGAPVGFVVGAVAGYRLSADDISTSVDVAPDGSGAKLTIGGTF